MEKKFRLEGDYIKLDSLLKATGVAETGGMAKSMIQAGYVFVNNELETRRGRKLYRSDRVMVDGEISIEVV